MAEPSIIRQREKQLVARAKAEDAARQKRKEAASRRGQQSLEAYRPSTITGALYNAGERAVSGINRLFGASERDAAQRGSQAIANLKNLTEGLLGVEETEGAFQRIGNRNADASDYALAGLTVAPMPAPVRRFAAKVGKKAVGKAKNLAAKGKSTKVGKYLTEGRPLSDRDYVDAPFSVSSSKPAAAQRALPAPPKRPALPKPFTVPVVPADTSTSRVLPTLNVSDKGGLMEAYEPYTEMVPVSWLENLEGNELRYGGEKLKALSDDIATRGFRNPLIVSVGKESGSAILGEGNHRLAAAKLAGMTHVPVRVAVGDEIGGTFAGRSDLVPLAGKYFPSQAKPSSVFTSLQEGADPSLSYMKLREQPPMDPELQALLDEFNAYQILEGLNTRKARGGLAVKRKKK